MNSRVSHNIDRKASRPPKGPPNGELVGADCADQRGERKNEAVLILSNVNGIRGERPKRRMARPTRLLNLPLLHGLPDILTSSYGNAKVGGLSIQTRLPRAEGKRFAPCEAGSQSLALLHNGPRNVAEV